MRASRTHGGSYRADAGGFRISAGRERSAGRRSLHGSATSRPRKRVSAGACTHRHESRIADSCGAGHRFCPWRSGIPGVWRNKKGRPEGRPEVMPGTLMTRPGQGSEVDFPDHGTRKRAPRRPMIVFSMRSHMRRSESKSTLRTTAPRFGACIGGHLLLRDDGDSEGSASTRDPVGQFAYRPRRLASPVVEDKLSAAIR